jgi:hypothetical protein
MKKSNKSYKDMMIEDALTNPYKELTLPETSEMYDRLENPDEDMREISEAKKRQKSYFERLKSKVK